MIDILREKSSPDMEGVWMAFQIKRASGLEFFFLFFFHGIRRSLSGARLRIVHAVRVRFWNSVAGWAAAREVEALL